MTGLTSAVNVTSGAIVAIDGPPSRRRLLAACPEGYEYRMGAVGTTFADTCACPSACGEATASCAVTASGNWTAILVPASVCAETSADNTGATVGGVVGGLLGLLHRLVHVVCQLPQPSSQDFCRSFLRSPP